MASDSDWSFLAIRNQIKFIDNYSLNQHSEAMEELLQLSEMEKKLFQLIKSQPRFEWSLLANGPTWTDYFPAKSIAKNIYIWFGDTK